jgi:hypothetical protein
MKQDHCYFLPVDVSAGRGCLTNGQDQEIVPGHLFNLLNSSYTTPPTTYSMK